MIIFRILLILIFVGFIASQIGRFMADCDEDIKRMKNRRIKGARLWKKTKT